MYIPVTVKHGKEVSNLLRIVSVIPTDGKLDMILFPGGYVTVSGTSVTFHYYTQDYLGNNRAVINGSTGAVEQTVAYYPYGAVIADLGTPTTDRPALQIRRQGADHRQRPKRVRLWHLFSVPPLPVLR